MLKLSTKNKAHLAKLVKLPFVQWAQQQAVKIFAPKHRIGVNIVCIDEQNRVLLLNHVFHPIHPWGLPGGWLSAKEMPEECALRELKEETNLQAEIDTLLMFKYKPDPPHLVIIYQAKAPTGQIDISNNEIIEARWFSQDELPDTLFSDTRIAIEKAQSMVNN